MLRQLNIKYENLKSFLNAYDDFKGNIEKASVNLRTSIEQPRAKYPRAVFDHTNIGLRNTKLALFYETSPTTRYYVGSASVSQHADILSSTHPDFIFAGKRLLHSFNIKPQWRGHGFASVLLSKTIEMLKPDYLQVYAADGGSMDNKSLMAFYSRYGFKHFPIQFDTDETDRGYMLMESAMPIMSKIKSSLTNTVKAATQEQLKETVVKEDDLLEELNSVEASFKPRNPNAAYKTKLQKMGPNALKKEVKTLATALNKQTTKLRVLKKDMMDRKKDGEIKKLDHLVTTTKKALSIARQVLSAKLDAKASKKKG